ncbi:nuclear transport factor 2-like isoform X1 [Diospyros lotus]|uniref:nuclear transport factor 2-like isoform X1 n=1 Tax=Diospyros lotus TaxID=55363 RepID=UPI0022577334|nr:nuclear transport factor 2-like isoform X1 [Diospyros lotus]XP_052195838.1 nuclear transport factor 2-like isoform X1 [Diospyros lotus]XP_052195839.1 nuclear transport factor 2-like isoform X1 [Diospyros lotus]
MAMETVSLHTPPAQVVGNAFVEQYYHILYQSPELVHRFYQDSSMLSRPETNGVMTSVTTMKGINDKICSFDYKNCKAEIKTADAQESYKDGVIVLVTGCLTGPDNIRRKFTQTFFLAPQDKGYFVLNDVFRYVEDSEPLENNKVAANANRDIPIASQMPDPEPVHPPTVDSMTSVIEEAQNVEEQKVHDPVDNERQAVSEKEVTVSPEPHLSENHIHEVIEADSSATQECAPKKSYASILSSQMRKGGSVPTKVYVPANTSRVAPTRTEKQSLGSVSHPPVPEALVPSASDTVNALESGNAEEEVEGYSVYVRNLPINVTVTQLEVAFKKFGPIKQGSVQVRSNKQQGFCFGFVEFHSLSSMNDAIQASPVTVGDRQAIVEMKRTTTRVGSGRGRFPPGRGGFRSDNFRGRGNYGGGRGYGRSDFSNRGDFSGRGRGGPGGYQQGRGRGGRRGGLNQNTVPA